jgi:hypothetical protein
MHGILVAQLLDILGIQTVKQNDRFGCGMLTLDAT